jgi:hypothetical protein
MIKFELIELEIIAIVLIEQGATIIPSFLKEPLEIAAPMSLIS